MDNDGFRDDDAAQNDFPGLSDVLDLRLGNFRRVELPEGMGSDDQRIVGRRFCNHGNHADIGNGGLPRQNLDAGEHDFFKSRRGNLQIILGIGLGIARLQTVFQCGSAKVDGFRVAAPVGLELFNHLLRFSRQ